MNIVERYIKKRREKDKLKQQLSALQQEIDDMERQVINYLENMNALSLKTNIGTVSIGERFSAKICDSDQAFAWLRNANMGDVIKETVHHSTLASIAKENEIPGVVTSTHTYVQLRGGKGNE